MPHYLELRNADLHDLRDTDTTRENYVAASAATGIKRNRKKLWLDAAPRSSPISRLAGRRRGDKPGQERRSAGSSADFMNSARVDAAHLPAGQAVASMPTASRRSRPAASSHRRCPTSRA